MWIIQIIKIKCFYPTQILNEHWCIYSCLQIPPRENFPCIITLDIQIIVSYPSLEYIHFELNEHTLQDLEA